MKSYYSVYDILSKKDNRVFAEDVPTRKEARTIKNNLGNAKIEQRKYALVSKKVIR